MLCQESDSIPVVELVSHVWALAAREARRVSMWLSWDGWSLSPIRSHEAGKSPHKKAHMFGGLGGRDRC